MSVFFQTDLVVSAVQQTGGRVKASSAVLQASILITGFILSIQKPKYSGLSVVVLQTMRDTNCIAFTSVAILLITSAVSVSDVSFAMFLCGTAAVGGLYL